MVFNIYILRIFYVHEVFTRFLTLALRNPRKVPESSQMQWPQKVFAHASVLHRSVSITFYLHTFHFHAIKFFKSCEGTVNTKFKYFLWPLANIHFTQKVKTRYFCFT